MCVATSPKLLALLVPCLNLVRSIPRKAVTILLSYPTVVGAISEACVFIVRIT